MGAYIIAACPAPSLVAPFAEKDVAAEMSELGQHALGAAEEAAIGNEQDLLGADDSFHLLCIGQVAA